MKFYRKNQMFYLILLYSFLVFIRIRRIGTGSHPYEKTFYVLGKPFIIRCEKILFSFLLLLPHIFLFFPQKREKDVFSTYSIFSFFSLPHIIHFPIPTFAVGKQSTRSLPKTFFCTFWVGRFLL